MGADAAGAAHAAGRVQGSASEPSGSGCRRARRLVPRWRLSGRHQPYRSAVMQMQRRRGGWVRTDGCGRRCGRRTGEQPGRRAGGGEAPARLGGRGVHLHGGLPALLGQQPARLRLHRCACFGKVGEGCGACGRGAGAGRVGRQGQYQQRHQQGGQGQQCTIPSQPVAGIRAVGADRCGGAGVQPEVPAARRVLAEWGYLK